MTRRSAALLASLSLAIACSGTGDDGTPDAGFGPPRFPESYLDDYVEMRDCRHSHEHELRHIRVFAGPLAQEAYAELSPSVPYPAGATLVKLEYELPGCKPEDFTQYTVLHKLAEGDGNWLWQRVSPDRVVLEEGSPPTCVNCHRVHCAPPEGYDLTCAEEL